MDLAPAAERVGSALRQLGVALPWMPAPLLDTYLAMIAARAVMAATSLGVFESLQASPAGAGELARRLELNPLGAGALLSALHALGYVRSDGDRFHNSRMTRRFLTAGSPLSLERWVGAFNYDTWDSLGSLEECLLRGGELGLHRRSSGDPFWEIYMRSLFQLSRLSAGPVAKAIQVRQPRRLLDVAGGHGGYSMAMCRRHRGLHATVLDLPGAVCAGRAIVREEGMQARVEHREMDVLQPGVTLGAGYDVAMVNAILHNLPPKSCQALLRNTRKALRTGGTIALVELEHPARGRRGSRVATLAGLLFVALTHSRTYDARTLCGWLRAVGFEDVRVRRILRLPGSVVVTAVA